MRLPQDLLSGTYCKPRLFLCETDKTKICQLETVDMQGVFKFNSYSELTFTVGRTYIDIITGKTNINPYYNKIEALRLVYLEGFGYFEIQDPEIYSDGIKEVKNVTAYSLEYSLSQKYLESLYINTGEVNSVEVVYAIDKNNNGIIESNEIDNIVFYNPTAFTEYDKKHSLLHIILEKTYGWHIGHVDASLRTMSRSFSISRTSVYDFITQDLCEKFNCFAVFDTINNTINFYAETLITKFIGDGNTTTFTITPAYNSIDTVTINSYKTTAYTYDNKTGILKFDIAPEDRSKIEVADGSQTKWITDVYVAFNNLAQEVNITYSADDIKTVLTVRGADNLDIREVNMGLPYITDLSYYYTVDWMGQDLYDAYTIYLQKINKSNDEYVNNATKMLEISNYIIYEKQRLSLEYSVASNITSETVGTYYVRGGTAPNYYFKEVLLPSEYSSKVDYYYTLSGNDLNETKVSNLYGAMQTYYMSETENDVSKIESLAVEFAFMETNTITSLTRQLKTADSTSEKDTAIRNFLDEMWEQLGLTPLDTLYYIPYKAKKDTYEEQGWNKSSNDNYWMYYPVTLILTSLEKAMNNRKETINVYNKRYQELQNSNAQISGTLELNNNFTSQQLVRLSSFLREDEYTDDNFIETDSDTIESLMQVKQELLECGKIELSKLSEPKLEFSMSMANIYALKEFKPIVDQFQLGNLINVALRHDYIKRARLLEVDINFDDFSDFSCEFGELTNLKTPSSIHADLLAAAMSAGKSVASNESHWDKGADLATSTDLKIQQGLLGSINGLYTSDQSVTIDDNGILLRKVNEDGSFSPYQAWLTSNTILLSSDGFAEGSMPRMGLGEFTVDGQTFYGILAEAVLSGYIEGSKIVGGQINIGDGTFIVNPDGSVVMKASSIDGYVEEDNVISSINQSAEQIAINANRISLAGKEIDLTSDNITIDSTNFSVTKDGKITATSGEIAGWTIYDHLLRKEIAINDVNYQMYMQAADGVDTTNAFAVRKKSSSDTDWDVQFAVNYEGKMTAKNANITGTITAKDGSIAGYNIGSGGSYSNALYKRVSNGSTYYEVGLKASNGETDLAFYVKKSTDNWSSDSNIFYVSNNGKLYAQNAVITGEINAESGTIGSWTVGDLGNYTNSIYSTYCAASTPSSSDPEYAVFMRGTGAANTIAIGVKKRTSSSTSWADADNPFYVRKDGYVKMSNANVTGEINASSGEISGNLNISGGLINTRGDYTVTLRGVQSTLTNGVFYITDNSSGTAEYPVRINGDGSAKFTNVTITGSSTIASACIPNLSAAKITAGTLDVDRIPNISASKITSGTISTARLDASVITTGNFSSKSLSTGNLKIQSGCVLGSATYNATIGIRDQYVYISAAGPTSYGTTVHEIVRQAVENGSNRDIKSEIHDFDDRYDVFFDNLNPQLYKYNFDENAGYSMGYIWQETEEALLNANLTKNDIGAVYESAAVTGGLGLRKTDFIALNTWQIQKLKDRVEELERKLAALES